MDFQLERSMKILFLTIGLPNLSNNNSSFYADIIRELYNTGHSITAIAPAIDAQKTGIYYEGGIKVLRVKTSPFVGNYSTLKKVIGVLSMTPNYKKAIRHYLWNDHFDWIIMPTPPASLVEVADLVISHTGAKYYIILRDIHPESRVRLPNPQVLHRTDVYEECKKPYKQNIIIRFSLFLSAQKGYRKADVIGCMSKANIQFVKKIAPYVDNNKITLLPNWYKEPSQAKTYDLKATRERYGLSNKFIAIFGGNITVAQAVWNIATLAKANLNKKDVVFLVVGKGDSKTTLQAMANRDGLTNIMFLDYLPREDYEQILMASDLGIISIDEKYKVPTCPSKIIGYLALRKPVIAMFNYENDYGEYYMGGNLCGLWSVGLDNEKMIENFEWLYNHPKERKQMGEAGYKYFKQNFDVKVVCKELCKQLENG